MNNPNNSSEREALDKKLREAEERRRQDAERLRQMDAEARERDERMRKAMEALAAAQGGQAAQPQGSPDDAQPEPDTEPKTGIDTADINASVPGADTGSPEPAEDSGKGKPANGTRRSQRTGTPRLNLNRDEGDANFKMRQVAQPSSASNEKRPGIFARMAKGVAGAGVGLYEKLTGKNRRPGPAFDAAAAAEKIREELKDMNLPEEEKKALALKRFLEEKERFNHEKGGVGERLKRFDRWWNGLDKTRGGKVLKTGIGAFFTGGATVAAGVATGLLPASLWGIGVRLASKVGVAAGINMTLTSDRMRKWLASFNKDSGKKKSVLRQLLSVKGLAMVGGIGVSTILGGWVAGAVGLGGLAAKGGLEILMKKKLRALKEKREALAAGVTIEFNDSYDPNIFLENLDTFATEHDKVSGSLRRWKWAKNLMSGALTVGIGLGTIAATQHHIESEAAEARAEAEQADAQARELSSQIEQIKAAEIKSQGLVDRLSLQYAAAKADENVSPELLKTIKGNYLSALQEHARVLEAGENKLAELNADPQTRNSFHKELADIKDEIGEVKKETTPLVSTEETNQSGTSPATPEPASSNHNQEPPPPQPRETPARAEQRTSGNEPPQPTEQKAEPRAVEQTPPPANRTPDSAQRAPETKVQEQKVSTGTDATDQISEETLRTPLPAKTSAPAPEAAAPKPDTVPENATTNNVPEVEHRTPPTPTNTMSAPEQSAAEPAPSEHSPAPEQIHAAETVPAHETAPKPEVAQATADVQMDAVVREGEGVEHALRRQIENNAEISRALGFDESKETIQEFSGREAHELAVKYGLSDRIVTRPNEMAYPISIDKGGVVVDELRVSDRFPEDASSPDTNDTDDTSGIEGNEAGPSAAPAHHPDTAAETIKARIHEQMQTPDRDTDRTTLSEANADDTTFPHLSPEQNEALQHHPEFLRNPYHLSDQELWETYQASQKNIELLFGHKQSISWHFLKDVRASNLIEYTGADNERALAADYMRMLRSFTEDQHGPLEPKISLIFGKNETSEEYIARALQKITLLGRREDFESALKNSNLNYK